jgi:hypothetical protein
VSVRSPGSPPETELWSRGGRAKSRMDGSRRLQAPPCSGSTQTAVVDHVDHRVEADGRRPPFESWRILTKGGRFEFGAAVRSPFVRDGRRGIGNNRSCTKRDGAVQRCSVVRDGLLAYTMTR